MRWILISLFAFLATGVFAQKQKSAPVVKAIPVVQPVAVDYIGNALSALKAGDVSGAEKLLPEITNSAARIYVQACVERAKGDAHAAIQTISQAIARHYNDSDWIAESEMLSAELYLELGMMEEADVTARQVQTLYAGKDVVKKADALRLKILDVSKKTDKN